MRLPPRSQLSQTEHRVECPARPLHAALKQVCASPQPPWSNTDLRWRPGLSRGASLLDFPGGLVVQTQCLHCRAWVWFLVREVRSLRPCTAKRKETFKSNEHVWASQVVPVIKSLPANAGDGRDTGLSLGQEDRAPRGKAWHPTPVFLPGESQGHRSWVGYSPWGCKESDTTEAT